MSGRRTTGRPKLKWGDVTRKYTKSKEFKDRKHKTGELGEMKTRCANPRIGQMPRNRYAELATYVDKSSFVWNETKRGKRLSLTGEESHSDEAPHRGESVNADTPCRGNSPRHYVNKIYIYIIQFGHADTHFPHDCGTVDTYVNSSTSDALNSGVSRVGLKGGFQKSQM